MKKFLLLIVVLAFVITGCVIDPENPPENEYDNGYKTGYQDGYSDGEKEALEGLDILSEDERIDIINIQEVADFYNQNAVCVNAGESEYHHYYCYDFHEEEYYIFNVEYAESLGYVPCPACIE